MKPVFKYIDYRKYLKDFYDESKAAKPYFSYRFFAQRAGLKAPVLLKMVIDGKRNLSRKAIDKFIAGMGLKEKEASYFRDLVLFNQATSALEKQEHYRALRALSEMVPQFLVQDEHFDYFDKWYFCAIREGICQHDFRDDWEWVASSVLPRISPRQAQEAASWLLEHGFVKKLKNGSYKQVEKAITTRSEVRSMAVRNFNRKMMQLAEDSLDSVPIAKRYATGITVGLTGEGYAMMVSEIEAFRDRVVQIADSMESSDRVYQVGIQLFPLMMAPGGGEP